jgi:hypothetical protein
MLGGAFQQEIESFLSSAQIMLEHHIKYKRRVQLNINSTPPQPFDRNRIKRVP